MSHTLTMFDTLKYVSYLEDHGFSEKQAKGLLEAQGLVLEAQEAAMVTKADLDITRVQLENKLDKLEQRLLHKIDKSIFRSTLFLFTTMAGMISIAVAILV